MYGDDLQKVYRQRSTRRPAVLAWMRLPRVYLKINRASAKVFRRWDLSVAQSDILAQLWAHEGITQLELADKLLVTKGNVSQLLAKMERRGLLRREPEARAYRLYLTSAGGQLAEAAVPEQEDAVACRFGALTDDEQRQLLRLLRVLDQSLE